MPSNTALTVHTPPPLAPAGEPAAALVAAFLAGRNPRTLDAYRKDLEDFRAYVGAPTPDAAAAALFGGSQGEANALALGYRVHLTERGLSPNTINRRLAALRSLVKLARTLGRVAWSLDVQSAKAQAYRDTRGPGLDGFRALLNASGGQTPKAVRDRALLWLLFSPPLRRGEVAGLNLEDVERARGCVTALWVLGKGRADQERITLPARTGAALADWIEHRGEHPGALFLSLDPTRKGDGRLTGAGVYAVVRELGKRAGLGTVRPHGLRHAGITAALDAGMEVREVKRFSRHAKLETLMIYDDNREDLAGRVAERVASLVA